MTGLVYAQIWPEFKQTYLISLSVLNSPVHQGDLSIHISNVTQEEASFNPISTRGGQICPPF